jgi:DNA-binding LytR/AlgR family response regulator
VSKIKAVIADDEKQLRISLKAKLTELWPDLIICGEAKNGLEAIELIENNSPDIAFLDIRMPGLSGIEVAKKVAGTCRVIFITAYDQYAIEAFENEALDYILKPVTKKRLGKTVNRLKKQITSAPESLLSTSETVERVIESLRDKISPGYLQWIKAQYGDGIRLIPVDEVYYFKASDKYTLVITKERESLIKKSIKELAEGLDPNKFWRIHRGTIVNVSCIAKTSRSLTGRSLIKLKDRPEVLTVSRTYTHLLKQM